ncbi:hypothetical protein STCU_12149 [Strigomonas culicis]|uniref:Uncharacterized protein n=1 Tax=Strigomonas culicis TaxID=28005 RepID=S9TEA4_9TRYP|nr:hypothetical protein STCU_12149 [Strigomonas culicis]|eukprot:EPY15294.1 hypothetical protein STCU_12149 [Strigomonas culicis]
MERVGVVFADLATVDVRRPGRYLRLAPLKRHAAPHLYIAGEDMIEVVLVLGRQWCKCSLPLDGIWLPSAHAQINYLFLYMGLPVFHLQCTTDATLLIFHGVILNPLLSLRAQYVYRHAYIFLVETYAIATEPVLAMETLSLCNKLRTPSFSKKEDACGAKRCPTCQKPVVHHLGHGCHFINGCHRGNSDGWCYACGSISYNHCCPNRCPLFCRYRVTFDEDKHLHIERDGCDCPLCISCKPMRPCAQCTGCPACTLQMDV